MSYEYEEFTHDPKPVRTLVKSFRSGDVLRDQFGDLLFVLEVECDGTVYVVDLNEGLLYPLAECEWEARHLNKGETVTLKIVGEG